MEKQSGLAQGRVSIRLWTVISGHQRRAFRWEKGRLIPLAGSYRARPHPSNLRFLPGGMTVAGERPNGSVKSNDRGLIEPIAAE